MIGEGIPSTRRGIKTRMTLSNGFGRYVCLPVMLDDVSHTTTIGRGVI